MPKTTFQPRQQQLGSGAGEAIVPAVPGADSSINVQVATAKKYPRDVQRSLEKARQLATLNDEVAEECHYSIPRGGKQIEGPSVRLAEVVASCWGNLRIGARIVDI